MNDCYNYKVSNALIVLGTVSGLLFQLAEMGWSGLGSYTVGYLIPILALSALFAGRMIGAGDIKVFCVIGGYYGKSVILSCMLYSLFAGGIISLGYLIFYRDGRSRFRYLFQYINQCIAMKSIIPYRPENGSTAGCIHFTIAIAIGFFVLCIQNPAGMGLR